MVQIYCENYLKEMGTFLQPPVEQIIQQAVNKQIWIKLDNYINVSPNESDYLAMVKLITWLCGAANSQALQKVGNM